MSRTFSTKNGSVELEPEGPPDPDDRVLGEAAGRGHRPRAPVGGVLGPCLQRAGDDGLHLVIGDLARLTRARGVAQGFQTALEEARTPFAHRLDGHRLLGRHGGVGEAGGTIQDDAGS
jgi:hypothetical protein